MSCILPANSVSTESVLHCVLAHIGNTAELSMSLLSYAFIGALACTSRALRLSVQMHKLYKTHTSNILKQIEEGEREIKAHKERVNKYNNAELVFRNCDLDYPIDHELGIAIGACAMMMPEPERAAIKAEMQTMDVDSDYTFTERYHVAQVYLRNPEFCDAWVERTMTSLSGTDPDVFEALDYSFKKELEYVKENEHHPRVKFQELQYWLDIAMGFIYRWHGATEENIQIMKELVEAYKDIRMYESDAKDSGFEARVRDRYKDEEAILNRRMSCREVLSA